MSRTRSRMYRAVIGLWMAGFAGCGSVIGDVCERLENCNSLRFSESECAESGNNALDLLSDDQRAACEVGLEQCLELEACFDFTPCVGDLGSRCTGLAASN